MRDDLPTYGVSYRVAETGPQCELRTGEIVTFARRWNADFLSGGTILSFDVKRADGTIVTVTRGPRGAILEPVLEGEEPRV